MVVKSVMCFCGGPSTEHEISLISTLSIRKQLQKKYKVHIVGIQRNGDWVYTPPSESFSNENPDPRKVVLNKGESCFWNPSPKGGLIVDGKKVGADIYFPVIHSTLGEDGRIHTLFEFTGVPYVGVGLDGAIVSLNKDFTKRILAQHGIPVVPSITLYDSQSEKEQLTELKKAIKSFSFPLFVKPANQGSSVGVVKATSEEELKSAVKIALQMDRMVLVEKAIVGRELEISVLGNYKLSVSKPGEIVVVDDSFYTYEAKYVYPDRVKLNIVAKLDTKTTEQMQEMAKLAFRYLNCEGLTRIDFLLDEKTGTPYINEMNTMPGFTSISMYPKMLEAIGLSYGDVLDELIEAGLEAYRNRMKRQEAVLRWRPPKI